MKILELTKNSTSGIKHIEQIGSLSEWAVEFVKRENITRETVKTSSKFHELPRREKDAVRYQIKKSATRVMNRDSAEVQMNLVQPKANPPRWKSRRWTLRQSLMVGLSAWIAIFLLNDIVGIYQAKGLGYWVAWQAAILVELCIIVASLGSDGRLHRLAHCLVVYNALVFGCVEVGEVVGQYNHNQRSQGLVESKEQQIKTQREKMSDSDAASSTTLKHLSIQISKGYISSGSSAFEKLTTARSASEVTNRETLSKLESELQMLKSGEKSTPLAAITATLYFLLRCLLQLFSVWLLRNRKN